MRGYHVVFLVLEGLHSCEEIVHGSSVVIFVVHVEPELIDVDEVAQKRQHFATSGDPVQKSQSWICQQDGNQVF